MRITRRIINKLIVELSKEYEVRLHFKNDGGNSGCARYWGNSISININQSCVGMLSTFFHEMGHIYCFENSLWKSYHVNKPFEHLTKEEKSKFIRVALRAERWVDNWAKVEMNKHFPHLKYQDSYLSKEDGQEFMDEIKKMLND
jgi:hypothetical protein